MVSIRPRAATPHVAEVAGWLHAEWWAAEGWTLAATIGFLQAAPSWRPWLARLLVAPAARGGGSGRVSPRTKEAAAALGHRRLSLHTPDKAGFYATRGWRVTGQDVWCGRPTR